VRVRIPRVTVTRPRTIPSIASSAFAVLRTTVVPSLSRNCLATAPASHSWLPLWPWVVRFAKALPPLCRLPEAVGAGFAVADGARDDDTRCLVSEQPGKREDKQDRERNDGCDLR
jgi:hypothetical protein